MSVSSNQTQRQAEEAEGCRLQGQEQDCPFRAAPRPVLASTRP